jgi:DNA-binding NarL/FixJ family response regulator
LGWDRNPVRAREGSEERQAVDREDVRHVILIADGDPTFRAFAMGVLATAGSRFREAASGHEALAVAEEERVALVVLDVRLEGPSGYEVCRRLREVHGQGLPIVFVSADRTEPSDRVAGLLLGGDDYLAKPVEPDELLARVRRHLLRLETWNGVGVRLTSREHQVLKLLADGLGPTEISAELGISRKTVATHVEHIYAKLGVHTRAQAVASAFRLSLVEA